MCERERWDHAGLSPWLSLTLPWQRHSTTPVSPTQVTLQDRMLLLCLLAGKHPTYFPRQCCGKRGADHQSWQLSLPSCGCTHSCDTASDVKGEEKAAFSARHKHRDIIPPLILISFHRYSHITRSKPPDRVPPSLSLLSGFLTLLRNGVCASLPHIHLRWGTFCAACLYLEKKLQSLKIQLTACTTLKHTDSNQNP